VKATNPLAQAAQQGESMHYVHSKTTYYNLFLAEIWDECFVKTFGLVVHFTSSSQCRTLRI
jgi:hypothetical protein